MTGPAMPHRTRRPRLLHAGAWWLWALGLGAAASRTTNPLLLVLILGVTALAVGLRGGDAPWVRAYSAALRLGVVVIVIRVLFGIVFGIQLPGATLITLPQLPLPAWAAGMHLGGAVTTAQVVAAFYDGLRLATILVCVGAANALTGPTRLLKSVPGALYEAGVAVVVAMSLAPQLVLDAGRIREARRLRGRTTRGAAGVAGLVGPVLDGSLRRSLDLAAAMDSRGYGRTAQVPQRVRRTTSLLVLGALVGLCIGVYALLDGSSPRWLALPMLALGVVLAAAGLRLGGRRTTRTHYRPDPWLLPEWLVGLGGWIAAAAFWFLAAHDPTAVEGPVTPLAWPSLPMLAVAGLLVATASILAAPPVPLDDLDDIDDAEPTDGRTPPLDVDASSPVEVLA
jgi:energy-coupling factor transport system permease protein